MASYLKCVNSVYSDCSHHADFRPYLMYVVAICRKNESLYSHFPVDAKPEDDFPLKIPVPLFRALEVILVRTEVHSHEVFIRLLNTFIERFLFDTWKETLKDPSEFTKRCFEKDPPIDIEDLSEKCSRIHEDLTARMRTKMELDRAAKRRQMPLQECQSFEIDDKQLKKILNNLNKGLSHDPIRIPVFCQSTYATLFLVDKKQVPKEIRNLRDDYYFQTFVLMNIKSNEPIDYASELSDNKELFSTDFGSAKVEYHATVMKIICMMINTPSYSIEGLPPPLQKLLMPVDNPKKSLYCDAFEGEAAASRRGESKEFLE